MAASVPATLSPDSVITMQLRDHFPALKAKTDKGKSDRRISDGVKLMCKWEETDVGGGSVAQDSVVRDLIGKVSSQDVVGLL